MERRPDSRGRRADARLRPVLAAVAFAGIVAAALLVPPRLNARDGSVEIVQSPLPLPTVSPSGAPSPSVSPVAPTTTPTPRPSPVAPRLFRGNLGSREPAISGDGRYVAFTSEASNLVAGDTNRADDVFVRDRQSGKVERVSVTSNGRQVRGGSSYPALSRDGRIVAFISLSAELVPGDRNAENDIFVHDRSTGKTTRVSVSSSGREGTGSCSCAVGGPVISADGRFVAFNVPLRGLTQHGISGEAVYIHDRRTHETSLVSVAADGEPVSESAYVADISDDGGLVAFVSRGGPPEHNADVFIRDLDAGETTCVTCERTNGVYAASMSGDGRFLAYLTFAAHAPETALRFHYFVLDRRTGTSTWVGGGFTGDSGGLAEPGSIAIAGCGCAVAFSSDDPRLVESDTNGVSDVFVRDLRSGVIRRVSVSSSGAEGNGESFEMDLSDDGSLAVFRSHASNLVDGDRNRVKDVFAHDLRSRETVLISSALR